MWEEPGTHSVGGGSFSYVVHPSIGCGGQLGALWSTTPQMTLTRTLFFLFFPKRKIPTKKKCGERYVMDRPPCCRGTVYKGASPINGGMMLMFLLGLLGSSEKESFYPSTGEGCIVGSLTRTIQERDSEHTSQS